MKYCARRMDAGRSGKQGNRLSGRGKTSLSYCAKVVKTRNAECTLEDNPSRIGHNCEIYSRDKDAESIRKTLVSTKTGAVMGLIAR